MTIGIDEQIKCVGREIGMRKNVYPRWVANGKMTQAKADAEIATDWQRKHAAEQREAGQGRVSPALARLIAGDRSRTLISGLDE